MAREFELVPLDCPSCGAGMRADGEDVVYYCTACRNGYRFDVETRSLTAVEVSFIALAHTPADHYRPFWLLPARVTIRERQAKGGGFSGLMNFFFGSDEPEGAEGEGTFVIPAFKVSLAAVSELTRRYTEALPSLGENLGERLLGGCFGVEDAQKLAHFALIASEVNKPDTLTRLKYDIEFGPPRLLGVPFTRQEKGIADAVFGIRVPE